MQSSAPVVSFSADVEFLRQHGELTLLTAAHGGRIAVSARYQARVMTSAVSASGSSLGWVNRAPIASGKTGTPFDNYGGEDRFWLGPEGGQYSLYFAPKAPFTFDHWQTPHAFQEGAWEVKAQTPSSVTFVHAMRVSSYAGTTFDLEVTRTVRLLAASDLAA